MSLCKLTVRFEEPFWIGLVECEDGDGYSVAKHATTGTTCASRTRSKSRPRSPSASTPRGSAA